MYSKPMMLIVDASATNRRSLKRIFFGEYDFIEAKNGNEAMQALRGERLVSVVLLDAVIPGMNGFQILEKMQEDSHFSGIPVVVVTQQADEYTEIKALELGAADFIAKPYKPQIIRRRVKNIVIKSELEFKHKCRYDSLTGIYTKETFCEKTSQMLRENARKTYVLLRWNIERFKLINDLFGIEEGNRILIGMAKELADTINGIGTYGRLCADHFVMCFPYKLLDIEEIVKLVNDGFRQCKKDYTVVSNFGIYVVEDVTIPVDIMCDRANLALQSAKGNCIKPYAFYNEKYRLSILKEQGLIKDMNRALEEGQFEVYYQPIFSLSLGKAISAEALVRWNHPTKKLIPAGRFIPVFQKNGFIIKLDTFVCESVCKQLKVWKDSAEKFLPISINISLGSIYNPNLCAELMDIMGKYGVETSLLALEISESAYNEHLDTMRTLQQHGFSIIMDNFGSGYSCLNMLKNVPADILKIDLSFLEDFDKTWRAGSILTSIVRMAKRLKMPIIAVGVETRGQVEFLKSIGCDRLQGYYFSRPMPKAQFEAHIKKSIEFTPEKTATYNDTINLEELFNTNVVCNKIFNSIVVGIGIYEVFKNHLEVIRVNDGYYQIMGYNPKMIFDDVSYPFYGGFKEDRDVLIEKCRNVCKNQDTEAMVMRRYNTDGKLLSLEVNITYLGESMQRPLICISFKDITKQKIAESNLMHMCQRFHNIMGALPLAVGIYKLADRMEPVYSSLKLCEIFGFSKEEYEKNVKNDERDIFLAEFYEYLKENINFQEFVMDELPFAKIFLAKRKNGTNILIKAVGTLCKDENRDFMCYATISDITGTTESVK